MNRARFVFAATLVGASLFADMALAQATQAPPLSPILSGKKFVSPIRGKADIEYIQPKTTREKDMVVTKITVKNVASAPIARLTVDETWYAKDGSTISGGKGVINGLLQPGEVQTIVIETPFNAKMNTNNWVFTHANGAVGLHKVAKMTADDTKEPAAKPAAAAKKAPAKKK